MVRKLVGVGFGLLILFALGGVGTLNAEPVEVSIGFFYDALAPFGEWVTVNPYGWVWCPYDEGPGWRPYMDGDWMYSESGWVFDSPVEWGWACYHYGRWGFNDMYGWFWVPGTVWGPAWVTWRYGGGYIGWAPLPPEVGWSFRAGLEWDGFGLDFGISWPWWSFCEVSRFGERHLSQYVVASGRNMTLLRMTQNVTHYRTVGGRIVNENIGIAEVERQSGRTLPRYSIAENAGGGPRGPQVQGTVLRVYKPIVLADRSATPRNVLPQSRTSVSGQELDKRQKQEINGLSQRQRAEKEALSRTQQRETPQSAQQELEQRHQAERKALEQQQRKEAQALENRHKREQEQRQAAESERRKSTGSQPVKKK